MRCFVGCEEKLVDVLTKRQLGVPAQLQVQVRQGPQLSVFGLLGQAMVFKPSYRYEKRFGKRIKCAALLVVKKTWLMCPDKATVGCPSANASSSALRSTGVSFWTFGSSNGC